MHCSVPFSILVILYFSAFILAQECPQSPCTDECYFHGSCQNGACYCAQGWTGDNCTVSTCDNCVHGSCRIDGSCSCDKGYIGEFCNITKCLGSKPCCTLEGYCSGDSQEQPDLMIYPNTLRPYLEVIDFDECHCAVDEGCVPAGTRLLLRFNTETRNIGNASIQIGKPGASEEHWEWHSCHEHFHFKNFAEFRLVGDEGEVARAHKSGFCMVDSFAFDRHGHEARIYDCETSQGIQAGWSDWYESELDCQWVDVTGLDSSRLWSLELEVNPAHILPESNYDNNLLSIPLECAESCNPTIAQCLFGECICLENTPSATCYYVDGIEPFFRPVPVTSVSNESSFPTSTTYDLTTVSPSTPLEESTTSISSGETTFESTMYEYTSTFVDTSSSQRISSAQSNSTTADENSSPTTYLFSVCFLIFVLLL